MDLKRVFLSLFEKVVDVYDKPGEIFVDMARFLHTEHAVPISDLRKTLKEFYIDFNDICVHCKREMVNGADGQTYCSDACRIDACGCKADPTCCGHDGRRDF
jgi:hypothetical protein